MIDVNSLSSDNSDIKVLICFCLCVVTVGNKLLHTDMSRTVLHHPDLCQLPLSMLSYTILLVMTKVLYCTVCPRIFVIVLFSDKFSRSSLLE